MPFLMLSSKTYNDNTKDHGDCFIVISRGEALIYDCGSEEHARRVEALLIQHHIDKAIAVLSHNDDDHFLGFKYLIENGFISHFLTIDVRNYKTEILKEIDDGRKTNKSISEQIDNVYDNLADISKLITVHDIYDDSYLLPSFAVFSGPELSNMISAAAKGLDTTQSNSIQNTSFTNAASIQLTISIGNNKILLTGDCSPENIPDSTSPQKLTYIQLPHHGNADAAEKIFDWVDNSGFNNRLVYLVSDNKGTSSGGSNNLNTKGRNVKNTKDGDIVVDDAYSYKSIQRPERKLGL